MRIRTRYYASMAALGAALWISGIMLGTLIGRIEFEGHFGIVIWSMTTSIYLGMALMTIGGGMTLKRYSDSRITTLRKRAKEDRRYDDLLKDFLSDYARNRPAGMISKRFTSESPYDNKIFSIKKRQ